MLLPPGEGVNGIFDAYPKVVNPPQVVETNVNMCPMNSSLQIPRLPLQEVGVGARLMHFVGQWEEISVDTYILEVVRSGYCLEFKELPPPTGVIHTSMPGSIEKVCVIEKEILTLLQKNAIEKVPENEKSLGFYSTIFLTKKKSGGLRPILNLSNLNLYLQRFHFRMETLRSIIKSLQQGEWTIALDLTDAYFHVPIRPSHRRYLRFCFNGQCYQYRALPFGLSFGLSTALRLFTKVVQVIAGHLRQESIHCHQYLDDWLLKNKSRSLLLAQAQKAIDVTVKLGFLINKEKSNLRPSQSFVYLGAHFDLKLGRVFLTQERSVLIQDLIGLFRLHEYLPAQTFLKLLGTMASCIDVIPYAHLHMRPIQMYLLFYWKPSQRDVQSLIPVSSQLISHLEWWTIPQNLFKGVPLSPLSPDMVLTTDASKSGWGAHLDDLTVQGVWSSQEQQLHILLQNMENLNFKEKIDNVNKEITSWKKRNLTTLGKITVVKTLLLPKFTHLFTSLPKPSHETIKKLESIFFNFIWNDKRDRVARKILCQDKAKGGCRMVKIDTYIKGLKLTWMRRIFQRNQNYKWVQLFFDITDIEEKYLTVLGDCYIKKKLNGIDNLFWKEVLQYMTEFHGVIPYENKEILKKPLWLNSEIKIDGKEVFYKTWYNKGIHNIQDLLDDMGNMLSYDQFCEKYELYNTPFTHFYGIVNVITNKWPVLKNLYCREYGPIIPKYLEILCKDKKGSRALYDIFLNNITSIPKSENKWELLLNLGYDLNWKKIYQNIFNFTNDTKLIWFQYRIIHRILATNKYLHAIKIKNDPLCSFCSIDVETIDHLFFECDTIRQLWLNIQEWINLKTNENLSISLCDVLFLRNEKKFCSLNICIVLVKLYIYTKRFHDKTVTINEVKRLLISYYELEKYIYKTKFQLEKFHTRWEFLHGLFAQ